jgi:ABC-type transport system involved in Fe-S cluster assembly fused permease/ATPase subunit
VSKTRSHLSYLLTCFRGYGPRVTVTLLCLTLARVASTADPLYLKHVIDGLIAHRPYAAVAGAVAVYFALRLASLVGEFLRDWIFAPTQVGMGRRVSELLFDHLLRLSVSYHVENQSGALARKIARGTRAFTFMLDFLVMNVLPTLVELLLVTALLLRVYPGSYGLITFGTVALYTWFTIWGTEARQKYRLSANLAEDESSGIQIDTISNIETVKYFNNEALRRREFGASIGRWYTLLVRSNRLFSVVAAGQSAILLVGLGAILFLAIRETYAGRLTIGDLVLLSTYVVRLSTPISALGWVYRAIKDGLSDLDEMGRILENPVTLPEPEHPVELSSPQGEVRFESVSFTYKGRDQVLEHVDLTVRPGERVAIVGPSGAGKSTLVKLLFRFHDPTAGRVLIDGVDLRELGVASRRRALAIVPQEPVLFNETIASNVRFGKPDATQAEIEAACRLANIHDFIAALPEGYETVVGERGLKMSGGEKQRIAIARAIIRDPKILVFDEATSNLDSRSERIIQESLHEVARGRTTLVIAHRLSTIVDSDRILVLHHGRIAESGTHDQLLSLGGLYSQLWSIQTRLPDDASEAEPVPELATAF